VLLSGCTRRYFRLDADNEVGSILEEKDTFAEWELRDFNVYPSPWARFYDPSDPDRPPMPPDDPAAWLLSPHPQKPRRISAFEGVGYVELLEEWDRLNRTQDQEKKFAEAEHVPTLPKPAEQTPPPPDAPKADQYANTPLGNEAVERRYKINLEQAVELGVLNSREYQSRREDLYLVALPVTLERFAFAPQYEATVNALREISGSKLGGENSWQVDGAVQMSKQFYTGGLLLVQLANQTVVNLTGNDKHTISQSNFIVDLSQPFLQGGGRAVVMENLTQAERDLLYELRDYARFHREFFVNIAAGSAGLTGYYDSLLQLAALRNELRIQQELSDLRFQYQKLATNPLAVGGRGISQLQVDEVKQNEQTSQSTILVLTTRYENGLDQFKLQLGLPTDFPLEIDHSLLDPLYKQIYGFEEIIKTSRLILRRLATFDTENPMGVEARPAIRRLLELSKFFRSTLELWESESKSVTPLRLQAHRDEQKRLQDELIRLERENQPIPPELEVRLNQIKLLADIVAMELAIRAVEAEPWKREVLLAAQERVRKESFDRLIKATADVVTQTKRVQLDEIAREDRWPALPPVLLNGIDLIELMNKQGEKGILEAQNLVGQTALVNRLDLMNERGRLVDSWRGIAVFANSLLGAFDVRYHMDVATPAGLAQPLDFEGQRSRHQLFINTELPLTRVQQRNSYRASLIAYQRQRRNLMATEDQILLQVRQNLRLLLQQEGEYRIQQRSVNLAYRTVDNSREEIEQATGDPAAQTNQLLSNIQRQVRAENAIITAWVNYITTRMEFYRDLELLRVDSRGVWIDEFTTENQRQVPFPPCP
jgi:hypothetical protein